MTFFVMQPKSSLVLGRLLPQTLVNLTAMDIFYKKPCQYGHQTLSVTDCNDQKKSVTFFSYSTTDDTWDKLGITSQSCNYTIVIPPTTRYGFPVCLTILSILLISLNFFLYLYFWLRPLSHSANLRTRATHTHRNVRCIDCTLGQTTACYVCKVCCGVMRLRS